jgi:putative spermidine/putrescine transport system ATP-binding protein
MTDLNVTHVVKHFGTVVAVDGVDIHVGDGVLLSLLGPSGCGKTTLLRMIAGLENPDDGTIRIGDDDVTDVPASRRGIGMVFQSYALFPNMTAAANIGYGLRLRRWSKSDIQERVREMVELTQLGDAAGRYPHQLSGGQQQRVALARALAIRPRLLLLDEPLSALDAQVRVTLREGIRRIQQQLGITTVYVTHDQEEALSISDEVVVMRAGRIEQQGPPEQLYGRPATPFVASFVGAANRLPATVTDLVGRTVSWGDNQIRVADLGASAVGDRVVIIVRPERLHVLGPASEEQAAHTDLSVIEGVVEQRLFLGSSSRIRVATQAGEIVAETPSDVLPPERGDRVRLGLPPDACIVLRDVGVPVVDPDLDAA